MERFWCTFFLSKCERSKKVHLYAQFSRAIKELMLNTVGCPHLFLVGHMLGVQGVQRVNPLDHQQPAFRNLKGFLGRVPVASFHVVHRRLDRFAAHLM